MHVSGAQLQSLSGVAALLRFPLPDIEDMEL
jgi:protein pelota